MSVGYRGYGASTATDAGKGSTAGKFGSRLAVEDSDSRGYSSAGQRAGGEGGSSFHGRQKHHRRAHSEGLHLDRGPAVGRIGAVVCKEGGSPRSAKRVGRPVAHHASLSQFIVPQIEAPEKIDLDSFSSFYCNVDFSKPDALRNRALVVEGRRLYVCDHYLAVWSQVFQNAFMSSSHSAGDKSEMVIPGKPYSDFLELLECIYPQQKSVTADNINMVLPLAYEYQFSGLLRKCVQYLLNAPLTLMDKILLADRFSLEKLLTICIRQFQFPTQIDFHSPQYAALSDRTKVRLLERLHTSEFSGAFDFDAQFMDLSDIDQTELMNLTRFNQKSELFYATLRSKSGRLYHVNPYYLAAWSQVLHEQVIIMNSSDLSCSATDEELLHFLWASNPPLLDITDSNIAWVLRAACKLESVGLIRQCAEHLLNRSTSVNVLDKISLLDRCYLYELFDPCLRLILDPNVVIALIAHPTYETLSIRAKASTLDRLAYLLRKRNLLENHYCTRCEQMIACAQMRSWVCPQCNCYNGEMRNMVVTRATATTAIAAGSRSYGVGRGCTITSTI